MHITASGLQRFMVCAASAVLPQSGSITEAATDGTWRHEFLRLVPEVGMVEAFERLPDEQREKLAKLDLDELPLGSDAYRTEVAFVMNVLTGEARVVGQNIGRAYPELAHGEVAGTADVVALLDDDAVYVGDYKGQDRTTPKAADNWQMRFLAMAACAAYGRSRAVVELIHLDEDGVAWKSRATFDAIELLGFQAELAEQVQTAEAMEESGKLRVVESSRCGRCPAFARCPEKAGLAASLATGNPHALPELTPEIAPAVLERLEAAEAVLKHVRQRLEEYATAHPFALPSGEKYGAVETSRETIDPVKGSLLLAERFGAEVGQKAMKNEPTMPKNRVTLALKDWMSKNPGHKISKLEAEALAMLRAGGAVSEKVYTTVKRFAPEVPKLPEAGEGAS